MPSSKTQPLVSVISAAHNVEKYIGETIESIQKQTYPNWELIIADDASTDNTVSVVESYIRRDQRIKLIRRNVSGGGPGPALNDATALAKGVYVAIQDSDDISLPTRLDEEVAFLEKHKEYAGVSCSVELMSEDGSTILGIKRKSTDQTLLLFLLLLRPQFIHGSMLVTKQALTDIGGYDPAYVPVDDYEIQCRLVQKGKALANLDSVLYKYRMRGASITHHESFAPRAATLVIDIIQNNIIPYFSISKAEADMLLQYIIDKPLRFWETLASIRLHRKLARMYISKNNIPKKEAAKILTFYKNERNHHIRSYIKRYA